MAEIVFDGVSKAFEDGTLAVHDLHLTIADGEFLVLVGPSGCGKTTSLRMAAGLEDPTAGEIRIGGTVVNDLPSRARDIAMVFQNYALYPHMSVLDNLAFGLRMRGVSKRQRYDEARRAAAVLGITDLLGRQPKQLSGGQRQRVAMGRAIVRKPKAFLMDEPLSNLDAKLRVQMRAEIARIQRSVGTTTLYVTHDQVEAMTMADRVAVMRRGVLQQVAAPAEVYERPVNLFVASFIGSPPMSLFEGRLVAATDTPEPGAWVELGPERLLVPGAAVAALAGESGRPVVVGIRPEALEDAAFAPGTPPERRLRAVVELVELLGSDVLVRGSIDARPARHDQLDDTAEDPTEGDAAGGALAGGLVARCNARSRPTPGAGIELAVDLDQLHLFDPVSGLRLDA